MTKFNEVKNYFKVNYPHVDIEGVGVFTIESFLKNPYVKSLSDTNQMDLFYDYILSDNFYEITK